MAVFFFSYHFPDYVDDPLVLFHAKYLKYVCLIATFLIVIEAQLYLGGLISRQKDVIEIQNIDLINQKHEILAQQDEIMTQRDQAQEQNLIITEQKKHITESINYASQIQTALIPSCEEVLKNYEYFILYKPKETISGDFYWVYNHNERIIITVADCTGHGVPGALLSVLGITYLNEIITHADDDISAGDILNQLRKRIVQVFKNEDKEKQRYDGMDIALYIIEKNRKELQFAGAFNSLFILRKSSSEKANISVDSETIKLFKGEEHILINLSGDPMPIGISRLNNSFSTQKIKLLKNDVLYVFSDGYVDQFGGMYGKKFMTSSFRKILLEIQKSSMNEQKEILNTTIENWRYENPALDLFQLDDITVLGLKV